MTPQRYRFVVRSAEEAVKVIRARLGEDARVVAVRQVEGKGLARFLSAPKLEVTAEVGGQPAAQKASDEPPEETESIAEKVFAATADATPPVPPADPPPATTPAPAAAAKSLLVRLVESAGISAPVLARLRAHESWPELELLPAGRGLERVAALLSVQLNAAPRRRLGNRIVFVGSPGAGKTTALCKLLATDTFVRQRRVAVVKLDLDSANPSDGLAVFCEAMGVPCSRSVEEVPQGDHGALVYVDLPGVSLDDSEQLDRLAAEIAPLAPTSHVLVVNAAYDSAILKHLCHAGEQMGCTHLVLTHCDELIHWGKLCDVLLGTQLTPLFLGTGQNIAGDLEEHVVPTILARTFPALGKEAAWEAVVS